MKELRLEDIFEEDCDNIVNALYTAKNKGCLYVKYNNDVYDVDTKEKINIYKIIR